jgi:hypothetical protein
MKQHRVAAVVALLDRRTLAKQLEQRGIPRRSRRLTDKQIQETIQLCTDA